MISMMKHFFEHSEIACGMIEFIEKEDFKFVHVKNYKFYKKNYFLKLNLQTTKIFHRSFENLKGKKACK